jgi:hypothetical protein
VAKAAIEAEEAARRMPDRPLIEADFSAGGRRHEKKETTAKLAQINLAVHGLQDTVSGREEVLAAFPSIKRSAAESVHPQMAP